MRARIVILALLCVLSIDFARAQVCKPVKDVVVRSNSSAASVAKLAQACYYNYQEFDSHYGASAASEYSDLAKKFGGSLDYNQGNYDKFINSSCHFSNEAEARSTFQYYYQETLTDVDLSAYKACLDATANSFTCYPAPQGDEVSVVLSNRILTNGAALTMNGNLNVSGGTIISGGNLTDGTPIPKGQYTVVIKRDQGKDVSFHLNSMALGVGYPCDVYVAAPPERPRLSATQQNCDHFVNQTSAIPAAYSKYSSALSNYRSYKQQQLTMIMQRYPYPHSDGWNIGLANERNAAANAVSVQINGISAMDQAADSATRRFNTAKNWCIPNAKSGGQADAPCQSAVLNATNAASTLSAQSAKFNTDATRQYQTASSAAATGPQDASLNIAQWRHNVGIFDSNFSAMDLAAQNLNGSMYSLATAVSSVAQVCK
ncbi:hypothetical protein [Paraburkholderia caribensis]|uniref:hypothetical protein n=1 Tax=Paraburkholderia caribensis TaxID=75105 RepID=UPI0034D35E12